MLSFINYLGVQSKFIKKIYSRKDLNLVDKNIYIEIFDLSASSGVCTAKNQYFISGFGISVATVKRSLQKLVDMGMIEVSYKVARQGREIRLVESEIKRLAQNEPGPAQNEPGQIINKNYDDTTEGLKNEVEYKTKYKILSKDNSTKYGNEDINKFISKINSLLDIKLPEDGKARMTVSNMLKLLSRHEKRLWLKESKWDNAKDWFDQYHQTNLSKGFYPRSWYKVYENLKLWIANEGDLSKLNKK